jgi:hypothetical protein
MKNVHNGENRRQVMEKVRQHRICQENSGGATEKVNGKKKPGTPKPSDDNKSPTFSHWDTVFQRSCGIWGSSD